MQIVRAYLEIEQRRLGDRLSVDIQVEDAALPVVIPVLSIQPLVENAIKHGVAQRTDPGYIRIRATVHRGDLRIAVENSVASVAKGRTGDASRTGVGLQNVRRRLEICYGSASGLQLSFGVQSTIAELLIPAVEGALTQPR
jgi:LytS/YehU family sensor histidine kinase